MSKDLDQGWKQSPAHLELLSKFRKGRDIAQVLDWQYLRDSLGEPTKDAIDRFISLGALIPCTPEEALTLSLKVGELKSILKEHGLKVSGKKSELIARVKEHVPEDAKELVSGQRLIKCSPEALSYLEEYYSARETAETHAKKQAFEYLRNGNIKAAYRTYIEHQRVYYDSHATAHDYEAEEIAGILQYEPDSFSGLSQQEMKTLQCAIALKRLWYSENPSNWIHNEELSGGISVKRAIAHMDRGFDI